MNTLGSPLIAIMDTSPDLIGILTEILDMEGFDTVSAYIVEFRKGNKDIRAFLSEHQPQVVIYDIAFPYVENWQFFNHVRQISGLKNCQFIIVTTNKKALDELVGPTDSIEIIGKPLDFDRLTNAVRTSLQHCTGHPS